VIRLSALALLLGVAASFAPAPARTALGDARAFDALVRAGSAREADAESASEMRRNREALAAYAGALRLFAAADRAAPSPSARRLVVRPFVAYTDLELGVAYDRAGNRSRALAAWRDALAEVPVPDYATTVSPGDDLMRARRWQAAFAAYARGPRAPDDPALRAAAGNNLRTAIALWRRAVAADPNGVRERYLLAAALYASGRRSDAFAAWRDVIATRRVVTMQPPLTNYQLAAARMLLAFFR